MFADSEFEEACQELDDPLLNDWEFFTQSASREISIYRQYNEKSGLYAYKIFGTMEVPADICLKVFLDLEYRKFWDPYIKDIREISSRDRKGIYWLVNFPFPLSKRDMVMVRETRVLNIEGRKVSVTLSKADDVLNELEPLPKGVVRVNELRQSMAITSHGTHSAKAFSYYYDDPGGLIPSWVLNWAAKTGIPALLANLEKGCREYDDYLKQKMAESENAKKTSPKTSPIAVVATR